LKNKISRLELEKSVLELQIADLLAKIARLTKENENLANLARSRLEEILNLKSQLSIADNEIQNLRAFETEAKQWEKLAK
jgi:Asp-tRNA(Asn)/Glu-tRNA(Gln) amidotransferase C subunit